MTKSGVDMATETPTMLSSIEKHLPEPWEPMFSSDGCVCPRLDSASAEYQRVHSDFQSSPHRLKVDSIQRVQNPYLYGMYLLKKAEYVATKPNTSEHELWHATSKENAENIVKTNFDWRLSNRTKFGNGVSFSTSAKYANDQCNRSTPVERVSIRCKVLVGSMSYGSRGLELPDEGKDTTIGNGTYVYVKFADYEFYPEYIVHYKST